MSEEPAIAAGQTWLPTKAGSGWRYVCEADRTSVVYRVGSGSRRRLWTWEFHAWRRRFECILKPQPDDA
jgi:hypothetical protein